MANGQTIRLNLGCGEDILTGYVNSDVTRHRPDVDIAHDLRVLPWPWPADSVEEIRLFDVLEHLPEVVPVIDECWRVLNPGGVLHVRVPHYQHETAWLDPTHRRAFHIDSFDYFDPDTYWGGRYGFYTQRKWTVRQKEMRDGNVIVRMHTRKDIRLEPEGWRPYTWEERVARALAEIVTMIPRGEDFVLVDGDVWGTNEVIEGRRRIRFLERDGEYWGAPSDDEAAIQELDRLRRTGAHFIVFGWPAFWWLTYYSRLHRHLLLASQSVRETAHLVLFDLLPAGAGERTHVWGATPGLAAPDAAEHLK